MVLFSYFFRVINAACESLNVIYRLREHYTVARRYEFYVWVAKTIPHKWDTVLATRALKTHILELTLCKFLFIHHHGISSRTKIYEGCGPCRLQVHSWLTRPICDGQVWLQPLQLKVWFGLVLLMRFSLLHHLSLRLALLVSSKEETAWWMVWCWASQSAAE